MKKPHNTQRVGRVIILISTAGLLIAWLRYQIPGHVSHPTQQQVKLQTMQHVHSLDTGAKQRIVAYIGVMTGYTDANHYKGKYDYQLRRKTLRKTWFPADKDARAKWAAQGVVVRFVVGQAGDSTRATANGREEIREVTEGDDFLLLPIPETYGGLPFKVLSFLRAILSAYSCQYIYKVDDDIYMRLDRVLPAVIQWQNAKADYVGCMKQGQVFADKNLRWYEPQHSLLADHYFTHCWGSAYVISSSAARLVAEVPEGQLRFFSNEDVTVGSWMLAFNLTHYDDRRFCETKCSKSSLVVYDYPECAGLCNPSEQLQELHASEECKLPAVDATTGEVPLKRPIFHFTAVQQLTMHQE